MILFFIWLHAVRVLSVWIYNLTKFFSFVVELSTTNIDSWFLLCSFPLIDFLIRRFFTFWIFTTSLFVVRLRTVGLFVVRYFCLSRLFSQDCSPFSFLPGKSLSPDFLLWSFLQLNVRESDGFRATFYCQMVFVRTLSIILTVRL